MEVSKNTFLVLPSFIQERTQKFTSIVFTLIALSVFGLFAINPTLSTIAKLKKELKDSEFVHQGLQQKISNLSSLQKQYSLLQDDIPIVLSSIPNDPNVPMLIADIQSVAVSSDINVKSLQNFAVELAKQKPSTDKKYYSFSFSLAGMGGYDNILSFISSLSNMQRVVTFDVLSVNSTSNQNEPLRINVQGTAYYK